MKLKDLMDQRRKMPNTALSLDKELELSDIDVDNIRACSEEYINITDEKGKSDGGIKREILLYLLDASPCRQFEKILEEIGEAVIAIDADSRIFFVNKAYNKILDVQTAKIIGRYMNVIEPNAALLTVLKSGRSSRITDQHIETVNRYVDCQMFPLYNDGAVCGAFSVFTDNTSIHHMSRQVEQITGIARDYSEQLSSIQTLKDLNVIGEDAAYRNCLEQAIAVARTDATVLVRGENGTGKEVITNLIKENSGRASKPFVTVNCSAIPESLMESELFGYEAGSFTGGSKSGRMGKFQLANEGTIFLDEIGDMPLHMQAKLLRVLQNGEIEKIGRQKTIPIDVRVIAATNQPLEEMIEKKLFREDLYYRLNVVSISIPPLRQRGNDIVLLAEHFLDEFNKKYDRQAVISREVYDIMLNYGWPGNVRELINAVERAVILCGDNEIKPCHLPMSLNNYKAIFPQHDTPVKAEIAAENEAALRGEKEHKISYKDLNSEMDAYEKKILEETLIRFGGSKTKAMEALGVPRRTFYRKLAYHGIT